MTRMVGWWALPSALHGLEKEAEKGLCFQWSPGLLPPPLSAAAPGSPSGRWEKRCRATARHAVQSWAHRTGRKEGLSHLFFIFLLYYHDGL